MRRRHPSKGEASMTKFFAIFALFFGVFFFVVGFMSDQEGSAVRQIVVHLKMLIGVLFFIVVAVLQTKE